MFYVKNERMKLHILISYDLISHILKAFEMHSVIFDEKIKKIKLHNCSGEVNRCHR